MSPDDIFAAQFWPWPDPAIKRDAQGRVLFVNAAFLALYGGQVENWRGNAVGGWPAPQASGGTPYRFETRMPGMDGSEQIYDWMEQTLADGSAFALARNVTVFTHAPQPDPAATMVPEHVEQTQAAPLTEPPAVVPAYQQGEPVYQHETVDAQIGTVPETHVENHAPIEPIFESAPTQQFEAPEIPDVPMLQEETAMDAIPVPEIEIPNIEIPSDELYAMTETPQETEVSYEASDMSQEIIQEPAAQTSTAAPEREFERRALPLGDNSSVLGSNWRDAVIARAIGADDPTQAAKAETEEVVAVVEATAAESSGGPIRILLAEDNAINALLTRTLLEAEGHIVDTVEDGALAVQAMKTSTYDLIFMDMRMPNMDGLEATRKIRSLNAAGRRLPIIALTANAFDDDRNACFDSGMNDFMTKPVSAEELSEKVQDWTSEEAKARLMNAA